jgi:2-hydroxychromene-2-carboxylate isomerase
MSRASSILLLTTSFFVGMLLMWALGRGAAPVALATPEPPRLEGPRAVNPGAVKVELYVMSQCPYGVKAEQAFDPVIAKLGADVDYRVEYIGDKTPAGELSSMHGQKEVTGDIVQLCAMKHSPKWVELIACQNESWRNVDTNWDACAKKLGIATESIGACLGGSEGKELLAASFDRSQKKGASGSPTIYIGGTEYEGGRRVPDLMRAICNAYAGAKPAACAEIPELPKVNVTLLGDKRCGKECDLDRLEAQTRNIVGNPSITKVDVTEAAGKALFAAIGPATLPAVVFDATLDADAEAKQAVGEGIRMAGEHRVVTLGDWNPACADEGGCKLDACKGNLQCRAEVPNKLEVFVMSQCPYGVKALDAMREVLDHFKAGGAKLDFAVHFIGNGSAASGFESLHGQPEVDEDIRQACAIKHYGKDHAFMKYIWCRNPKIQDPSWQACTGDKTGVDAKVLEKCASGDEGKELLEKSFALSNAAKVSSSPSWIVNGKFPFSGIDAETIKTQVCAHNKLPGCDQKLSGAAPAAAGQQPGCE